jgi:hypothetical protein
MCRRLELFSEASVAIDGSKFKAVNTRDRNFTQAKMQRRPERTSRFRTRSWRSLRSEFTSAAPLLHDRRGEGSTHVSRIAWC